MAQCAKCGSRKLMRLPSSREEEARWRCLKCGNEWHEEKKPLTLIQTAAFKEGRATSELRPSAQVPGRIDWARIPSLTVTLLLDIEPFEDVKRTLNEYQRIKETFSENVKQTQPDRTSEEIIEIMKEKCQILVSQDKYQDHSLAGRSEKERALLEDKSRFALNVERILEYCVKNNIECVKQSGDRMCENKMGNMMCALSNMRGDIVLLTDVYAEVFQDNPRKVLDALLEFHDPKLKLILGVEKDVQKKPRAAFIRTESLITESLLNPDYFVEKKKFLGRISYKSRLCSPGDYYSVGDIIRCIEFNLFRREIPSSASIKHIDYLGFL